MYTNYYDALDLQYKRCTELIEKRDLHPSLRQEYDAWFRTFLQHEALYASIKEELARRYVESKK